MNHSLILIAVYTIMFLLMVTAALVSNSVACEILSLAWGVGLLLAVNNYEKNRSV